MKAYRLTLLAALAVAPAAQALAQDFVSTQPDRNATLRPALTPDYRNARSPMPGVRSLPPSAFDYNAAFRAGQAEPEAGEVGGRGGADARGLAVRLFDPAPDQLRTEGPNPNAVGTQGLQFTSSRVDPSATDTTYPFRTVGKLWFTDPSGAWFVCSGSMIKPGIVATAGHCVASGSGQWYSNFQFIPSYRNGSAPYGTWTSWASATTTGTWFSGGGGVPNAGDYALIVFNRNASGYRIGDYTGWLGWQYPSLVGKHVTVLGYPQNLDSGAIKHRVDAQTTSGSNSTGLWGSDMRGGSSGGPVVLNFRVDYSASSSAPQDDGSNRLVSVVSYGPVAEGPMYQGGTIFSSTFQTLLNNMCTSYSWAC